MDTPADPEKGKPGGFVKRLWNWMFRKRASAEQKTNEPFAIKAMSFAKNYWLIIFFCAIFSGMLGYMWYDMSHPDQSAAVLAHNKDMKDIAVADSYVAGYTDGRQTVPAATVTLKPGADGTYTGTVELPKGGAVVGSNAQGAMAVPDIYQSGQAHLWDTVVSILGWLLGLLMPLILMNIFARMIVGKPEPGQSKIALIRLFNRATDQQAQGGTAKTANEKGSMAITVVKPENNPFRLSDFIGNEEVDKELKPLIKAAKAQGIQHKLDVAAAIAAEKKKKPSSSEQYLNTVAALVPVPAIPQGRFGHIQNTKYILAGRPGTGKTLWPMVAAGESGLTLLTVAGTFQRIFIGAGTQNVEALVAMAQKHAPCFVFLDEGEEGAKARTEDIGNGGANSDDSTTALLRAIDGVETKLGINQSHGIHWILATNHVKKIDPAMQRSGRLKVLTFSTPNLASLKRLLRLFFGKLKKLPFAPDFNTDNFASILLGKTGADIQSLANEFAGLAEEIAEREEKRLNSRAKKERKRLEAQGISDPEEIEKHLAEGGLSVAQIEKHIDGLTFGPAEFVESVLRLLMGHKKSGTSETFAYVRDISWHEGMHGLASASMEWLNLLDWKVRFFAVGSRQNTGGLMYSSPESDESMLSIANVLARSVVAYAGGMGQLVGHDDAERFGHEIDLYRDFGVTGDNQQADALIHQAVTTAGGSLEIGQISKGQGGHTWFSELGRTSVDEIDRVVRIRQKLAQFLAWRITSILMQNETTWEVFDEVLNSPDRLILQDRFYQLFDKIMSDAKTRRQMSALPAEYRKLAASDKQVLAWKPSRQPLLARWFIRSKTDWLETRYLETRRLDAQRAKEVEVLESEDDFSTPAQAAAAVQAEKPPA